jgi:hypothetical protein
MFIWNASFRVQHTSLRFAVHKLSWKEKNNAVKDSYNKESTESQNSTFLGGVYGNFQGGLKFLNPFDKKDLDSNEGARFNINDQSPNGVVLFFRRHFLSLWDTKPAMWPADVSDDMGLTYMKKRGPPYAPPTSLSDPIAADSFNAKKINWFSAKFTKFFQTDTSRAEDEEDGKLRVLLRRNSRSRNAAVSESRPLLERVSSFGKRFRQAIVHVKSGRQKEQNTGQSQSTSITQRSATSSINREQDFSDLDLDDMFKLFEVNY